MTEAVAKNTNKPPSYQEALEQEQPLQPGYPQPQVGYSPSHPYPGQPQSPGQSQTGYYYAAPGQPAPALAGPGGVIYQQPTVIMVAPQPMANPPDDYLVYSIVVTILCCWPVGIFAIIKSVNCRDAARRGDQANAMRYSNEAKKYASIALGVGIAVMVIWIVVVMVYYMFILNMITTDF
ncbi:proline-rich transmembrane protein 1-like [Tubulanus polymorphus]|uniref:proline-rich transmembrane protein 1-like n=1 Tax=Tubulanus polymorphus TaxID=672921 RepID=UPI003DA3C337